MELDESEHAREQFGQGDNVGLTVLKDQRPFGFTKRPSSHAKFTGFVLITSSDRLGSKPERPHAIEQTKPIAPLRLPFRGSDLKVRRTVGNAPKFGIQVKDPRRDGPTESKMAGYFRGGIEGDVQGPIVRRYWAGRHWSIPQPLTNGLTAE
jgi:hypothetical protein